MESVVRAAHDEMIGLTVEGHDADSRLTPGDFTSRRRAVWSTALVKREWSSTYFSYRAVKPA
jgi:hypothetical protein